MDTLKAARERESVGLSKQHMEAITRVINEFGRADLVTRDYLDIRLWQQTVLIIGANAAIVSLVVGLFKLFG